MHIYAFGSICRGQIDINSDVDLLVITNGYDSKFDPCKFSIYSYSRINDLWKEGNPFAWHLYNESKLIYSCDGIDFIYKLDKPNPYSNCINDCHKFYKLFLNAFSSINNNCSSLIFELSTIFLSIRNFATCYLLGEKQITDFSRNSVNNKNLRQLSLSFSSFKILEGCRLLSTRGIGKSISKNELSTILKELPLIKNWMEEILNEVKKNG